MNTKEIIALENVREAISNRRSMYRNASIRALELSGRPTVSRVKSHRLYNIYLVLSSKADAYYDALMTTYKLEDLIKN